MIGCDGSSDYRSARSRTDFWLFCAAMFLAFLTLSTLAYLSVVLASVGMTEGQIGMVLSSPLAPVILAILLSGRLLQRFSPLSVVLCGQFVNLAAS